MAFPVPSLGRFLGFRAGKTWSLVLSWDGAGGGEGGASHPGGGIRKEPRSCQELGTGWEQGTRSSGGGVWEGLLRNVAFPWELGGWLLAPGRNEEDGRGLW